MIEAVLSGSLIKPGEARPISVSALFIYAMWITILGVATGDPGKLAVTTLLTGIPGLVLGYRRYGMLVPLIGLALIGSFVNMVVLYNVGSPVFSLGPLTVREEAWRRTLGLSFRILTLAGAGLLFASAINPRDAVKTLESELGMPRGFAFALAFALRLLPLIYRDLQEVLAVRRMRGYRRVPISPGDYRSIIMPLLSISVERGLWVGIAAELRGLSIRPKRRFKPRFKRMDLALLVLALVQTLAVTGHLGL